MNSELLLYKPKLLLVLSPINEYISGLIQKELDEKDLYPLIFQLVVRLQMIIELKCDKYHIKLESADTSMDYLELLCQMIKSNSETKIFLDLVNQTDSYFTEQQKKFLYSSPHSKARVLRKTVSSVDEETDIFDILTLHELEVQRWRILVKLLNRVS